MGEYLDGSDPQLRAELPTTSMAWMRFVPDPVIGGYGGQMTFLEDKEKMSIWQITLAFLFSLTGTGADPYAVTYPDPFPTLMLMWHKFLMEQ